MKNILVGINRTRLIVLFSILGAAVLWFQNRPIQAVSPTSPDGEILIAQYADGRNAVTSSGDYSGIISLTVSGIGQASGTQYSDAFYILTDSQGNPTTPYHPEDWILSINNELAEVFIPNHEVPAYRSDHVYTFEINAPGGPLIFGVDDGFVPDNTGSYVIQIEGASACIPPYFSQRDPQWEDHPLRTNGQCSQYCSTIGTCGCTLTSSAMLFAYYGADITPPTLSDCLGDSACPFSWSHGAWCSNGSATMGNQYPFSWEILDFKLNQEQRPVILGMHKNDGSTHWVLVVSGQGNLASGYLVHDPWPLDGSNTNMAVLAREGYIFDRLVVYDGQPVCGAATANQVESILTDSPEELFNSNNAPNQTVVTGEVTIFHVELTAIIFQLSASSSAGNITDMLVWVDSDPNPEWQPFTALTWLPWEPNDLVHARFRDDQGNVSSEYIDSIYPDLSPPPLPTLTPTPTSTPTATPTPTATVTPTATPLPSIWLPIVFQGLPTQTK